jgi:hypothetical protein
MFYFDPLYFVFALPALLFALFAQWKVKSAYDKYTRVPNERGMTGLQAARQLISANGLNIALESAEGHLTDHYDPMSKTVRLSSDVARMPSVAALGIVAHELGHAMQDKTGYTLLRLRGTMVPAVNIGSWLGPIFFMIGIWINFTGLAWLGVAAFSLAFVFALVTLPVELDASSRALKMLQANNLVSRFEYDGVKAVLTAAALTYIAAVAQALSQLLYYLFILLGRGRDND